MTITYPLFIQDDSGQPVSGATVTVASVVDKAGTAIASPGATVSAAGSNYSVDYDAETKGEAWITLTVSKAGSGFTGFNAAPALFCARDSGRVLVALPNVAAGANGGLPTGDASGRVDLGKWIGVAPLALLSQLVQSSLPASERTAVANEVEAQIIDDTDSEKVLKAINDKIASANPSLAGLTLAAIASQVRTELTTELADIVSLEARLSALRAGYIDKLNVAGVLANTSNAPSFMATGFATPTNVSDSQTAIIAALPAAAPSAGDVLDAFKADPDWAVMVGGVNGCFTYDPDTDIMVLKDFTNTTTLVAYHVTRNVNGIVLTRISS